MELSIVIPAYNEARRIGLTLEKIYAYLDDQEISAQVLVVDDGSTDGTGDVALKAAGEHACEVLSYGGNRGKGFAVRYGLLRAQGERVLMTDADLSTPIEELARLDTALDKGSDVAIGSRAVAGANVVVSQAGLRKYAGKIFNLIVRVLTGLPFKDTQCGFKLFDTRRCRPVFEAMRLDGFSFDVEALFLAQRLGLRISELPVEWHNSPESKVDFVRDSLRMFRDMFKIRWWAVTGSYELNRLPAENV